MANTTQDLSHIAWIKQGLAVVFTTQGQYDLAVEQLQEALTINQQINYQQGIAHNHFNIADTLYNKGDTDGALAHLQQALTVAKQINNKLLLALIYHGLANCHQVQHKAHEPATALCYAQKAHTLYTQLNHPDVTKTKALIDKLNC